MRIKATKMDGCGNSFLIVDEMRTPLAGFDRAQISNALAMQHETDGVIYLDRQQGLPTMRIFDCDGTEETMCGNGLRCATRFLRDTYISSDMFSIITGDGKKEVLVHDDLVEANLGEVRNYWQDNHQVHFVFTGVPHVVVIGSELDVETARVWGKSLREEQSLCELVGHPEGVNVDFIWRDQEGISVRTYEMGVEDITKSCGTGSAASAYVAAKVFGITLPIITNSIGGSLQIRENNGHLSICGPTRYQGKVIGFANTTYPKSATPINHWQRGYAWLSM